jgi:ectoine hydrolase
MAPAFSTAEYQERLTRLKAQLREAGIDVCVIVAPELLNYFAGYDGHTHFSDQALVVGVDDDAPTFIYRDVDAGLAAESVWLEDQRTYHYGESDALAEIAAACRERGGQSATIGVGFNTHGLKGNNALRLQALLSPNPVVDCSVLLEAIRLVKSDAEIACVREAARLASVGLDRAAEVVTPGMTETQLAGQIDAAMRDLGGDYPAMPAWVSSGARTSGAHKTPSDKVIERGDRIKLEFTGVHRRYHAITMQTLWVEQAPSQAVQAIYEVCGEALRAGEAAIGPGVPVAEAESAAFSVLEANGFDLRWHSRFGYGVGVAYPPTWLESLDITRESEQLFENRHSFCLHVAVKDPVEGLGMMLGGAYIITDGHLECLSGGALPLTVA